MTLREISKDAKDEEMIVFAMQVWDAPDTRAQLRHRFGLTSKECDSILSRARTRVFQDSIWRPKDDHRHSILDKLDKIITGDTQTHLILQAIRIKMDLLKLDKDDPIEYVIDQKEKLTTKIMENTVDKLLTDGRSDRNAYFDKLD